MKIVRADIYRINLPLREPFIISYATYHSMPSVVIKLYTDNGIVGFGESVPDEHVTGDSIHSVYEVLKHYLLPAIIGMDPRNIHLIHEQMNQTLMRNGAAKAAIDIACYDILGKYSDLPIYTLLGGRKRKQASIPKVLSILEPKVLAKQAKEAIQEEYKEIKMKLGTDSHFDIQRVQAVREAVGNGVPMRVDVNQGWETVQEAKKAMKALEPYQLSWVEQPISAQDVSLFRHVKESTSIPLMADESLVTSQDLRTFIEHRSVDYINIKLMKSGGIYPAYQLATQAELFGIQCQIGSMVESSIASSAGFHVALSHKNIVSTEISGPTKFTVDPGDLSYALPYVHLSEKPGLGIQVDEEIVTRLCVEKETIYG